MDVSSEEPKRKQKGYPQNDNGHRSFVARICADWHRIQRDVHPFKRFVQFKTFYADEITVYGCLMGRAYEIRTQWVYNGCKAFFYGRQDFFYVFFILFASASAVGPDLKGSSVSAKVFPAHCPLVWLTRVELVFPDLLGRLLGVGGDSPVVRQFQHPATVDDAVTGL